MIVSQENIWLEGENDRVPEDPSLTYFLMMKYITL